MSVALGGGIGLLYGVASWLTARLAMRYGRGRSGSSRFMALFVAGMLVRMALALVLVVLMLLWVEVQVFAFVGTLLLVFLLGLGIEVWVVHHRLPGHNG